MSSDPSNGGIDDSENEGGEQFKYEESALMSAMQDAISMQNAAFCCGGQIPITAIADEGEEHRFDDVVGLITSPPVVIRWDLPSGKTTRKITLPPFASSTDGTTSIEGLLKTCAPATFGKKGDEVLDESYRKAVKLDSNQFSTSFNPYEVGIIDAIAQSLLPGIAKQFSDEKSKYEEHLGVIAELYKLNIYSGPGGKFRAHVDTPRSATQFGSLVVCLPHAHQGGSLRVAHGGQELTWDWGSENPGLIQWAAFYSDCEHEVMEVTSGHRVTLTYNLYVHERVGGLMRSQSVIEKDSFALHHRVKEALASRSFMKDGGTLGFYCRHAYAHTNDDHTKRLPFALKGVDAIFYSAFHHLGVRVNMQAVMDDLGDDDGYEDQLDYDSDDSRKGAELVATGLHGLQLTEDGGDDGSDGVVDIVREAWESRWRKDIRWFNGPGHQEMAVVHLAYGNQPSIAWHYSFAAILVDVPAFNSKLRTELCQGK